MLFLLFILAKFADILTTKKLIDTLAVFVWQLVAASLVSVVEEKIETVIITTLEMK